MTAKPDSSVSAAALRRRLSPPGPVANSGAVFHGNHMMVGMALGFLFLSGTSLSQLLIMLCTGFRVQHSVGCRWQQLRSPAAAALPFAGNRTSLHVLCSAALTSRWSWHALRMGCASEASHETLAEINWPTHVAGGTRSFASTPAATAALVISLFPRFPVAPTDNRWHLQVRPYPQQLQVGARA